ncbi:MAG: lipoprotein-releasing ABC transporter permease subunit [Nitrospirae bacterium]|nr:lipoprotein-releasing ABC transporter permease subunit [Nitrospirota bacterium]
MNLPYQLFISLRYLRTKRKQKGISLNTAISILGIMLGVMALIIVLSVMGGFQDDLQRKILGVNAHLVVLSYDGRVKDQDLLMEKVNKVSGVIHSSPFIYGQAMLGSNDRAHGIVVRGIDPGLEGRTTDILKNLKEGKISGLNQGSDIPGIIVGIELARTLGLFVGDEINMISPMSEIGPLGAIPKMKKFKVAGIFEAGMYEYDSSLAYVHIKKAQEFFRYEADVSGIEVKVDDIYKTGEIGGKIEKLLGPPYYARDWIDMNRNLFAALKLEKIAMFIILVLIVLVASFSIVSNLVMIVIDKAREIAILKAMGATSRGIMYIFMIYGLIIGTAGTVLGIIGGYIVCYLLKTYRFISLPADVYYFSYLPVRMSLFDFVVVPLSAILITLMATVYPSWQASKLNPVEPLRYE